MRFTRAESRGSNPHGRVITTTAAIDPIAPFAFAADEVFPVGVVQPLGNRIELAIIDRALVIQADVDVGTFRGAPVALEPPRTTPFRKGQAAILLRSFAQWLLWAW